MLSDGSNALQHVYEANLGAHVAFIFRSIELSYYLPSRLLNRVFGINPDIPPFLFFDVP